MQSMLRGLTKITMQILITSPFYLITITPTLLFTFQYVRSRIQDRESVYSYYLMENPSDEGIVAITCRSE
jgi:hypothetical protein